MDTAKAATDYIAIYILLVAMRPPGMFAPNGCPRSFGTGDDETLLPAWLVALALALRLNQAV